MKPPGDGILSIGPVGGIWLARSQAVPKFDSKTGELLQRVPFTINLANPYDNIITADGNFWAGGAAAQAGDTIELMDTRTGKLLELHSPSHDSTPAPAGFDAEGNPWFAGRGGSLLQLDPKPPQITAHPPPTRYFG